MSTHQKIRNAAIRLFATNGFDGTCIDELAKPSLPERQSNPLPKVESPGVRC